MTARKLKELEDWRMPGLRVLLRHVHGQHDELHDRGPRDGAAGNGTVLAVDSARMRWPKRPA